MDYIEGLAERIKHKAKETPVVNDNPYDIVRQFERRIATFCGSRYAVSVSSCSDALFLACWYAKVKTFDEIIIPSITYPSVPAAIIHAGGRVKFEEADWQDDPTSKHYYLKPTTIIDSAKMLNRDMYISGTLMCLSFHGKKILKIGRGGMILTDNKDAYEWFKLARFDGRHPCALPVDDIAFAGWNCYMTCEQAARGLEQAQWLKDINPTEKDEYQDLSKYKFYTEANRSNTEANR